MARTDRPTYRVDQDGVRTTDGGGIRTGIWLLSLAVLIFAVAVFVVVRPALRHLQAPRETAVPELAAHVAPPRATPMPQAAPAGSGAADTHHLPGGVSSADAGPPHARPQPPVAAPDVPPAPAAADTSADQPTGIAVFPPQGTKPILRGIIVPDDAELPPGYVRHYQATYDGRQLPPILMFHPDYHPVDANGAPIPLPEDRVVPPDMAPPGMPIQMLDIPEDGGPMPGTSARRQSQPNP
jgi:hypothetical protein